MSTTKNDDDRLHHYLSTRADAITVPSVDSSRIVARATRRRHRRRTTTAVAVVVVLAAGGTILATQRPGG